jgi:cyclin A
MKTKKTLKKKRKDVDYNTNLFSKILKDCLLRIPQREKCNKQVTYDSVWLDDFTIPDIPDRNSDVERDADKTKFKVANDCIINHLSRDIFQFFRHSELTKQPKKLYLEINQIEIDTAMRSTLIDWMVAAAEEYKLQSETLMLSVRYVDRYLSKNGARNLKRSNLQLVGVTSLLIASKYEELNAPHVDDLVDITDNSYEKEELLSMEWQILDTLLYETSQPTICSFIPRILKGNHISIRENEKMLILSLCSYLAELSMLDYELVTTFLPSMIASSCVLTSNLILYTDKPVWTNELQILSGNYRPTQLQDCCTIIYKCLRQSMCYENHLTSIREKYSALKYWNISKHNDVKRFVYTFNALPSFIFTDTF